MNGVLSKIGSVVTAVLVAGTFLYTVNASAQAFVEADIGAIKNRNSIGATTLPKLVNHNQLYVQFTGAGGVYLATQHVALMADPFFSNPRLGDLILLNDLQPDEAVIEQWLPPTENVAGVIVGHGHYDHLMDVPVILPRLPAAAKVFASKTSNHMLAASIPEARRVDLNSSMASATQRGEWVQVNSSLRILPIESEHSPHFAGIVVANAVLAEDSSSLLGDALDWQSGTTLSYVIDFLASGDAKDGSVEKNEVENVSVKYRVFFQSSSSGYPIGAPPKWLSDDGVPIDLAILCMANFDSVDNYPGGILNQLKPKNILLTHWESFWEPYIPNNATALPGLDIAKFIAQVKLSVPESTSLYLPQRGGAITLKK
ncbi:hypothetical protein A9Q81_10755 [Gammaproteobacteria bacterium 42_54_T18]|nr:hypothetical protein A9Q81_10755 [Gammaproteobacteria bacterium 42_54_T18]